MRCSEKCELDHKGWNVNNCRVRQIALRLIAFADLLWLVPSLILKQGWVLETGGRHLAPGSNWITLSATVLIVCPLLILPQRVRPCASVLLGAVVSFVLFSDVIYLRFFEDLPSFALMGAAGQTGQIADSIVSLIEKSDLRIFADLLPAALLAWWLGRLEGQRFLRLAVLALGLLLFLPGAWIWTTSTSKTGTGRLQFSHLKVASTAGVIGYHLLDGWNRARESMAGFSLTDSEWQQVVDHLERRRSLRAGNGDTFGVADGLNLLMIQVESLQGLVIGLEVEGQEITPTLNRLAREEGYLSLCVDQASLARTSDAELLSQASLLPSPHGAAVFRHAGNHLIGLADVLSEHGYTTLSAVAFKSSFWNRRYSHPALGFRTNLFDHDFEPGQQIGWGLNDVDFLRQMTGHLSRLEQPWCAFLLTLSLHHPYEGFPSNLRILDLGEMEASPVSGYLHAMRLADKAIAEMLAWLEKEGLADTTLLAIWGDHDGSIVRTRKMAESLGLPRKVPARLLEDRVPVIVRVPGTDLVRGEVSAPSGLVDLPPTLAALLGVDPAPIPWLGRNLFGTPGNGPVVWGKSRWIDTTHLYYARNDPPRCFDIRTMNRVPIEACAQGIEAAYRQREVATLILEVDLQQRLREAMDGEPN